MVANAGAASWALLSTARGDPSIAIPIVSAGGSATIVGALVYLVRQLVNGNLVARDVDRAEADLATLVREGQAREAAAYQREQDLRAIIFRQRGQ